MANAEKVVLRTAGPIFLVAVGLEVLSRFGHPELHLVARWLFAAGLFVVFIPIVAIVVMVVYEALARPNKH
jgi:hypothetical protein